jgi:hypothetical protein
VSPPLFIDETWAKTNMTRTHGRSPRGERLLAKVPHGRWRTLTFIAALRHDRITAPIEQMFSKLKTLLRKADERSVEATWGRYTERTQIYAKVLPCLRRRASGEAV